MYNSFTFRSGKYKGKSYEWVQDNDPRYIDWVIMERPEMIQERSRKTQYVEPAYLQEDEDEESTAQWKPLTPNYNFDNETAMTTTNEQIVAEQEIWSQITKLKIGLYSKLSKETKMNGRVKYDRRWLINTIFNEESDSEIRQKLINRLNGRP